VILSGATLDRFLGGRVTAAQPAKGFRAGHDTVLLAASVPADAGSEVLELGAGAGVASLCLAARVAGIRVTGIEIDPELVQLANENAVRNAMADGLRFEQAEIAEFAARGRAFDHVFFNPPFHPDTGQVSPSVARDRATRDVSQAVQEWTRAALAMTKHDGTVTAIIRADRADDMREAACPYGGVVFPLFPRLGQDPKRVIVRIVKSPGPGFAFADGLVLHEADGRNTDSAEAVLRHRAALHVAIA